jgi:hypothetical protein
MKYTSIGSQLRLVLPALLIGYATLHRLGQTYGSTSRERHAPMPGDGIVAKPQFVITHGITIDARPESVWPWLVQMAGTAAAGTPHVGSTSFYFRQIEQAQIKYSKSFKIFRSATSADGTPEASCGFVVEQLEPPQLLVLHSTTQLPLQWRRKGTASVDWTWVFNVMPLDSGGRARLIFRWRATTKPWWLTLGAWAVILPADF